MADNNNTTNEQSLAHFELERRTTSLQVESATLRENARSVEKLLARLELGQAKTETTLAEIQAGLSKINSFNESSFMTVSKMIDEKLIPIKSELELRKEEVQKLKTIIGVITFFGSIIWGLVVTFKEYLFKHV
jgi:hypothetical protein